MREGRARWKIENETFNTLKNQGHEFEHNYGHGYKNLSVTLAYLMMLAFLVDQAQLIGCKIVRMALESSKRLSEHAYCRRPSTLGPFVSRESVVTLNFYLSGIEFHSRS